MYSVASINEYIKINSGAVKTDYRQKFHMMPPVGWMNDPNGLVHYGGKYHLFYQYNPYDSRPGTMIWGHFISNDLIKYSDEGAAIVPQAEHVSIFSGGAAEVDGKLVAVYTEHYEDGDKKREEIYCSESDNGIEFTERKKLFDNANLPKNICRTDFRDPYPVYVNGRYYVFVGGKDRNLNKGVIIILGGNSLDDLEYKFTIGPFDELGDMGECPSWRKVDGKDVILVSGCRVPESGNSYKNENSSVFIVGDLDFERGEMKVDYIREIDKGDCFYAPQFINGADEAIMIGWQEMWGKPYPTQDLGHGWVGAFSIPRKLSIVGGEIIQTPVSSLEKYCFDYKGKGVPGCADIQVDFSGGGSATIEGINGSVTIGSADGRIYLDTLLSNNKNGCVRYTDKSYESARIILDISGIEVFADGGREAISSRIYLDGEFNIKTCGNAKISCIKKVEL